MDRDHEPKSFLGRLQRRMRRAEHAWDTNQRRLLLQRLAVELGAMYMFDDRRPMHGFCILSSLSPLTVQSALRDLGWFAFGETAGGVEMQQGTDRVRVTRLPAGTKIDCELT